MCCVKTTRMLCSSAFVWFLCRTKSPNCQCFEQSMSIPRLGLTLPGGGPSLSSYPCVAFILGHGPHCSRQGQPCWRGKQNRGQAAGFSGLGLGRGVGNTRGFCGPVGWGKSHRWARSQRACSGREGQVLENSNAAQPGQGPGDPASFTQHPDFPSRSGPGWSGPRILFILVSLHSAARTLKACAGHPLQVSPFFIVASGVLWKHCVPRGIPAQRHEDKSRKWLLEGAWRTEKLSVSF